jgi:hypothetical protein
VPHWCLYGPVPCAPLVSVWGCALCPTGDYVPVPCAPMVSMGLCSVPHWCMYVPVPCAPRCLYGPALYIVSKFLTRSCGIISTQDLQFLTTTNKYTVLILCISLLISCYMFRHICHHNGADTIILKVTAMRLQYETWKVKNALLNKHTAAALSECTIRKQCFISRISIISWYDMIWYDIWYDMICYVFLNCNWVDTQWQ